MNTRLAPVKGGMAQVRRCNPAHRRGEKDANENHGPISFDAGHEVDSKPTMQGSIPWKGARQPCRRALSGKYLGNAYQESTDTDNGINRHRLLVKIRVFHTLERSSILRGGTC